MVALLANIVGHNSAVDFLIFTEFYMKM